MLVLFRRRKIRRNRVGFVGKALFALKYVTIAAEVDEDEAATRIDRKRAIFSYKY